MIPTRIADDAPMSERRIFDLLRTAPESAGWTVLHSLGLASRGRRPYGEIDFVVLVPEMGILCLEVKGGRVRCEDGIWYTRDRNDRESQLSRSPVMQVRDAMFELLRAIRAHFGDGSDESRVIVGSAVVLPDVSAPPMGVEAESWEFIDRPTLSARPISRTILSVLRRQRERLGRDEAAKPENRALRSIRTFLRPDFDLVVARSTTIARAEEHLIRLTEEQFEVLDSLELNDRSVVEGAAGTGKTLLALELARRAAADGAKPIVLCFNKLLGGWIEDELRSIGCVSGSYHKLVRQLIRDSGAWAAFQADTRASGEPADFAEWPIYAVDALGEHGSLGDVLIVDESQDLATDGDLWVFDAMLKGGLAGGRWIMLGDFTRQAIFGGACADIGRAGLERMLRERSPHFAKLHLGRNCRNTRQIAEETAMLSGFDRMPYRLNAAEGPAVDYRFWEEPDEQLVQLTDALSDLMRDGVRPEHVTILSPIRFENSIASRLSGRGFRVAEATASAAERRGVLCFATIQGFKGMENAVVVLTDMRGIEAAGRQALLYVAMSRARTTLVMLVHQSFRPYVQSSMRRLLEQN